MQAENRFGIWNDTKFGAVTRMEKTVVKAINVLEMLARDSRPRALGEIASSCDITKSNAHRLLATLTELDFVRQVPDDRTYEVTLKLWELGMRVFERFDIRPIAAPHLRALQDKTDESVHLSIFDDGHAVYVDKLDSSHALRAYIRIGERAPAAHTATGRAMLAFLDEAAFLSASHDLKRHTLLTMMTPEALRAAIGDVRSQGYALTRGEWREGVVGVAAPIRTRSGAVMAGIGVAGPTERMTDEALTHAIDTVLATARAIAADLERSMS